MSPSVRPPDATEPLQTNSVAVYPGDVFRFKNTDPEYTLTVTNISDDRNGFYVYDSATEDVVELHKSAAWEAIMSDDRWLAPHWKCLGRETAELVDDGGVFYTVIIQAHLVLVPDADAGYGPSFCLSYARRRGDYIEPPHKMRFCKYRYKDTLSTALETLDETAFPALAEWSQQSSDVAEAAESLAGKLGPMAELRSEETRETIDFLDTLTDLPRRDWFDDAVRTRQQSAERNV